MESRLRRHVYDVGHEGGDAEVLQLPLESRAWRFVVAICLHSFGIFVRGFFVVAVPKLIAQIFCRSMRALNRLLFVLTGLSVIVQPFDSYAFSVPPSLIFMVRVFLWDLPQAFGDMAPGFYGVSAMVGNRCVRELRASG